PLFAHQVVGVERVGEDAQVVAAGLRDLDGEVEHAVRAGAQAADVVAAGGVELRHVRRGAFGSVAAVAAAGVLRVLRLVRPLPQVRWRGGRGAGPRGGQDDLVRGRLLQRRQVDDHGSVLDRDVAFGDERGLRRVAELPGPRDLP